MLNTIQQTRNIVINHAVPVKETVSVIPVFIEMRIAPGRAGRLSGARIMRRR